VGQTLCPVLDALLKWAAMVETTTLPSAAEMKDDLRFVLTASPRAPVVAIGNNSGCGACAYWRLNRFETSQASLRPPDRALERASWRCRLYAARLEQLFAPRLSGNFAPVQRKRWIALRKAAVTPWRGGGRNRP
jgi:hypothetical protein